MKNRVPAAYPDPPKDYVTTLAVKGDFYAFGWLLDRQGKERLRAFCDKVGCRAGLGAWGLYGSAHPWLTRWGKIRTFTIHYARETWVNTHRPSGGWVSRHSGYANRTPDDDLDDANETEARAKWGIPMIAIAFTLTRSMLDCRLTQIQLDWLEQLLGNAAWFKSHSGLHPGEDAHQRVDWNSQTVYSFPLKRRILHGVRVESKVLSYHKAHAFCNAALTHALTQDKKDKKKASSSHLKSALSDAARQ